MGMEIKTSLDWEQVSILLIQQQNALPYNRDLYRLYRNIVNMVRELSRLEVDARRLNAPYMTEEKIAEINSAIDRLEKLLLLAKLIN
jgi:hypothetical protein